MATVSPTTSPILPVSIETEWKIADFPEVGDVILKDDYIESEWFAHAPTGTKWRIVLEAYESSMSKLRVLVVPAAEQTASFKVYFRNRHGGRSLIGQGPDDLNHRRDAYGNFVKDGRNGVTFMRKCAEDNILKDGCLYIWVIIKFLRTSIPTSSSRIQTDTPTTTSAAVLTNGAGYCQVPDKQLRSMCKNLLSSGQNSDFKIVVTTAEPERTFDVHKFILAESSPVFAKSSERCSQFKNDSMEITEFSGEAVHEMLKYMYGFRLDLSGHNGSLLRELFQLSERYEIKPLQEILANDLRRFQTQTPAPSKSCESVHVELDSSANKQPEGAHGSARRIQLTEVNWRRKQPVDSSSAGCCMQ